VIDTNESIILPEGETTKTFDYEQPVMLSGDKELD
jgi:hypothetical protein